VNSPELDALVAEHDVVVSLIPYTYHAIVIRAAIKGKTHVVTTSYVSPSMKELEAEAKAAGIVVMNEIGLDPGIDHLYAVKTIDEVHEKGGNVSESYRIFSSTRLMLLCRSRNSCPIAAVFHQHQHRTTPSATSSPGPAEVSFLLFSTPRRSCLAPSQQTSRAVN
jgi:hypothetical protein